MPQHIAQRDQPQESAFSLLCVLFRLAVFRSTVIDNHESMYPSHSNKGKDRCQRALGAAREDTFKVYRPSCQSLSYCQVERLIRAQFEQGLCRWRWDQYDIGGQA